MYGLGIIFLGAVAIGALIGGIIVAIIWLVSYLFILKYESKRFRITKRDTENY